jgi:hypothetical protein
MIRQFSRASVSLALAGSAAFVGVATTAAPSFAVDCNVAHQNRTSSQPYADSGAPVRKGPHEGCGVVWTGPGSLNAQCWTENAAGNRWWYVEVTGHTSTAGWIYDQNLYPGGGIPIETAGTRCGT